MRRQILFHRHAAKYVKKMPADRKEKLLEALLALAALPDPSVNPNLSKMSGEWDGTWRLRVGSYRVICRFSLQDEDPAVVPSANVFEVLLVGPRGDIYK
jgi:mRNA-degrading endonuclease RelE of RelBE toxin-antitoxin system